MPETGPQRRQLEAALHQVGLEDIQVCRATGGYWIGFDHDDYQGFIAASVVRHNIAQNTLDEFVGAWADAAGLLPHSAFALEELNRNADRDAVA